MKRPKDNCGEEICIKGVPPPSTVQIVSILLPELQSALYIPNLLHPTEPPQRTNVDEFLPQQSPYHTMHITSLTSAALATSLFGLVYSAPTIPSAYLEASNRSIAPAPGVITNGLAPSEQESKHTNALTKRDNGRIEVVWEFTFDEGNTMTASWSVPSPHHFPSAPAL